MINLALTDRDQVKPCPFCGSTDLELNNTHTACYWISCDCGAEVHGDSFEPVARISTEEDHQKAKASVLDRWNARPEVPQ